MKQYILLLFIMIPLLSYSKTDMEKLLERVATLSKWMATTNNRKRRNSND